MWCLLTWKCLNFLLPLLNLTHFSPAWQCKSSDWFLNECKTRLKWTQFVTSYIVHWESSSTFEKIDSWLIKVCSPYEERSYCIIAMAQRINIYPVKSISRGEFVLNDRFSLKVFVIIDHIAELGGLFVDTSYKGSYFKMIPDPKLNKNMSDFWTLSSLIKCS